MRLKYNLLLLIFFSYVFVFGQISNPRHPAEWEEISGVVMEFHYFKNTQVSWEEALEPFVKTAQACIDEGINFYIINPPERKNHYNVPVALDTVFSNRNINSPLVHIIAADTIIDSFPWVRDHGMNLVYENEVEKRILYNFPNDRTGKFMAQYKNISNDTIKTKITDKYYGDGGNFLTDGHGTFNIATTYDAEHLPSGLMDEFDYLSQYFGIKKTLNIPTSFVHVDYFLKLIDEETAIVAFIPNNNYDISIDEFYNDQYYIDQAVISISQQLKSVYGREIKFIPIQNAPTTYDKESEIILHTSKATYTNSLILNKTVLVPQYKIAPFDELAINAYKKAMPGYTIIGINCRQYAQFSGAIHCLTHEIYAENPIYIKHKWYEGIVKNNLSGFPISVVAKSSDGILKAILYWKTNQTMPFQSLQMKNIENDIFEAIIPPAKSETVINYYMKFQNNNGKVIQKPMVAPKYSYSFIIQ